MATETKCDVCGVVVPQHSFNRTLFIEATGSKGVEYALEVQAKAKTPGSGSSFKPDLCSECFDKLIKKGLEKKPATPDKKS